MATVRTTRAAADAPAFKPTGGGYRAVAVGSIVLGADVFTAPETTGPAQRRHLPHVQTAERRRRLRRALPVLATGVRYVGRFHHAGLEPGS